MASFPADEMDAVAGRFPGRIGVCIKDLNTGLRYEYNADEPLPTASVVKVSIMLELFRQAHDGEKSLSTTGTGCARTSPATARGR